MKLLITTALNLANKVLSTITGNKVNISFGTLITAFAHLSIGGLAAKPATVFQQHDTDQCFRENNEGSIRKMFGEESQCTLEDEVYATRTVIKNVLALRDAN